jgi:L-lactate dehydrogenase (cytochrome)
VPRRWVSPVWLTADFSWVGNRECETRTGFTVPMNYFMRQCIDAIKSPAWTFDYMSRVLYGYKAAPEADFPAESLVAFIAAQMKPEFNWKDADEWLCSVRQLGAGGVARVEAQRAIKTQV